MRQPPNDQGSKNDGKIVAFKKVSRLLSLPLSALRDSPKYCLCYTCLELLINDTIINTVLCPSCPASLPMMNFDKFTDAIAEGDRKRIKNQAGGQPA